MPDLDLPHQKATYTGPLANLKGKTARIVAYPETGRCLAIFDDPDTGYGDYPRDFQTEHFLVEA